MSAHTPGPWRVESSHDINGELLAIGTTYQWPHGTHAFVGLAFTAHLGVGPYAAHREADARVMAAAPELLAGLKTLVAAVERDDNPSDEGHYSGSDEMEAARAAIAKAEGAPQ